LCAEHRAPSEIVQYKLGERVWLAARDEARSVWGDRFDLRRWHTDALGLGPLGLDAFTAELRRMISR
jgi:uncharacterized protein (DUF885 family)